jgi:SAM-dependent methyltransferase
METTDQKTVTDVYNFWQENPLYAGESAYAVGSPEWFQQWEQAYIDEFFTKKQPEPIYTLGLNHDSRILDVGCGPGFWVRYFLRCGYRHVFACDLTPRAVELAQKSIEVFGLSGDPVIEVGNAEELPYPEQSFDHINCQGVIHHTPNPGKCLHEFSRVLKPGGSLCFSVYYKVFLLRHPGLLKLFSRLFGRFISLPGRGRESFLCSGNAKEIVRLYDGADNPVGMAFSLEDIKELLPANLSITGLRRSYFPTRAFPVPIPNLVHRLLHKHFGMMITIRCEKS